jgi:hypothetical protein
MMSSPAYSPLFRIHVDRHPAGRAPRRPRLRRRNAVLAGENGRDRGAKLEIAGRGGFGR